MKWFKPVAVGESSGPFDTLLAALVIALLGFGVVMVFSASAVEATVTFSDPYYFLKRHALYAGVAFALILAVSNLDYRRLRPLTYPMLFIATALLLSSVVGFGHSGGGAARWLKFGPVHLQPSELSKLALILWLAYSLAKKRDHIKTFSIGLLPHVLLAGFLMLLCLRQPDFGGAVVLLLLTVALLFVAGARLVDLLGMGVVAAAAAAWLVRSREYRWERVLAWQFMEENRHSLAYQPFQSIMSFGSGEWFGLGIGKGLQVLYLPEAHNDFVAAIVGEELGFVGVVCLCLVYALVTARGVRAALSAPDEYGSYVAFGISMLFGIQALINLAVAMALLPTKGLTLPFVSYGGSSLLVNALAVGILLNISRTRSLTGQHVGGRADSSALVATESRARKARRSVTAREVTARAAT